MDISLFNYFLPKENIAQTPVEPRDASRLLRVNRAHQTTEHHIFREIENFLGENDVLVVNESKVFPARLFGKKETGQAVEILLLRPLENNNWLAIGKPRLKVGQTLFFENELTITILSKDASGEMEVRLNTDVTNLDGVLAQIGHTPIPPYIHSPMTENSLREKYQTVYAQNKGSAAAPTAGLHFTKGLLKVLQEKGVQIEKVTLHVGLGTFQNLRPENIETKKLHSEWYEISKETAFRLNAAKKQGKRIIAVGTTSARTLESAVQNGEIQPGAKTTQLFIFPPYQFQFVESLITNFHLPESSLLMLVSAFSSSPNTEKKFISFAENIIGMAYSEAIQKGYRFFSFGDAMWIE